MSGGVKNIMVRHCQFLGTDVGLRFKSTRGRGGIVENIFIDDITMTDIKTDAITFNMYYGGKSVAEMLADGDNPDNTTKLPVTEETPIFRHIDIRNVVCNGAGRAMEFNGLPEMPIEDITLENIRIIAKKDAEFSNYKDVKKSNVNIVLK
jgi:polygalacturonase